MTPDPSGDRIGPVDAEPFAAPEAAVIYSAAERPEAPLLPAILAMRCPRCGGAPLFAGWVRFADRCSMCALDYTRFNVGDGPAAFLILIVGSLIVALALTLQLSVEPPFWVHILLWVPITTALVIYSLRLAKAALLVLEYRHQAREGQIMQDDPIEQQGTPGV